MQHRLSQRVEAIPPSGIRRFFDIAATMHDVISLGIGEPDFVTPGPILQVGVQALRAGATHYTSNNGTMAFREALAASLERLYGVSYHPAAELLASLGASAGLSLALTAITNPGDEVLIPDPCFVAYAPMVTLAGGTPVMIPTRVEEGFQLSGAALEAAITARTKAILLGYPSNPTGAVMSRARLQEIAHVAERHDLLVISDEIYDRLVYGVEHICFPTLPGMRERTILLGGMSKSFAMTGWRIGYAAAPAEIMAGLRKVHQYLIMSAPTVAQAAATEALRNGDEHVSAMVEEYNRRRRLIVQGLNELGLACFEPHGAFYAFPSVAASGMDDHAFAESLLQEEQVAVIPGSVFGACGAGYVRCAYATAYEKIEQALERIGRFMRRHG